MRALRVTPALIWVTVYRRRVFIIASNFLFILCLLFVLRFLAAMFIYAIIHFHAKCIFPYSSLANFQMPNVGAWVLGRSSGCPRAPLDFCLTYYETMISFRGYKGSRNIFHHVEMNPPLVIWSVTSQEVIWFVKLSPVVYTVIRVRRWDKWTRKINGARRDFWYWELRLLESCQFISGICIF